jgi:hypothetical protein
MKGFSGLPAGGAIYREGRHGVGERGKKGGWVGGG